MISIFLFQNAIPWLDDKLFDMAKRLNCLLFHLFHKRKKLEEVEQIVDLMEKCPRPGSLPWEMDAVEEFHKIEYDIENMRGKNPLGHNVFVWRCAHRDVVKTRLSSPHS